MATLLHPKRLKVLVADDERVIANTLALIFNQNGFEAMAVYDGDQAIATAKSWLPDISLIDVVMEKNGVDAAMSISEFLPTCRILLFTGYMNTPELLVDAKARGYDFEILSKPVHPDALIRRLQG